MHRALGGLGEADLNEGRTSFTLVISPEVKSGEQIPRSWSRFLSSRFFADAFRQNIRNLPIGSMAMPAVCLDGRYVVVDLTPGLKQATTNAAQGRS